MKIKVSELRLGIDEDTEKLKSLACAKLGIPVEKINHWWIDRQSLDARKKRDISFVYSVVLDIEDSVLNIKELPEKVGYIDNEDEELRINRGSQKLTYPPVVIGTGPSGLFAAWTLAKWGYKPIVFERGKNIFDRQKDVVEFWENGELDTESNVQFGEGGAGTFSDGKLTTGIIDKHVSFILNTLKNAGAPSEITYKENPHIGTDKLRNVVFNLRNDIEKLGGSVFFEAKVTDFIISKDRIEAIIVNNRVEIPVSICILAIGHGARDTYEKLLKRNVNMEAKSFAIGLRIEHPQHMIDCAQYGVWAGNPRLGIADYHLTYKNNRFNRTVYTFDVCPGGQVIGASSEKKRLNVSGMGYYAKDTGNSNSAVVATVSENEFDFSDPLAGIVLQRKLEEKAFILGGGNYSAPVQTVDDFINDTILETPRSLKQPSYKPSVTTANLRECLPKEIGDILGKALVEFNKKIWGFASNKGILTGVETRASAPLRILRNDSYQAIGISGLYPIGEGAGYADGIMGASVDGVKVAREIIETYGLPNQNMPMDKLEQI